MWVTSELEEVFSRVAGTVPGISPTAGEVGEGGIGFPNPACKCGANAPTAAVRTLGIIVFKKPRAAGGAAAELAEVGAELAIGGNDRPMSISSSSSTCGTESIPRELVDDTGVRVLLIGPVLVLAPVLT